MAEEQEIQKATIAASPIAKAAAPKKRSSASKKGKAILVRSKRKESIARASTMPGKGHITVNGFDVNVIEPLEYREMMLEPVNFSETTKGIFSKMDISISVHGGGTSSQAQAVRGSIAKSLVEFSGGDSLKKAYMQYDRFMIVDDARRVEPKKFKGPKARARFQKSYR